MNIRIDFDKAEGKVKPLHGMNNAPQRGTRTELYQRIEEAGIPYCRFNDMGGMYGGGRYVDIANLFRNFDADPSLPESYDFAFTDWLFEHISAQGAKIFFRLGPSIENSHRIKAYYIYPPADNLKWAQICEGIIRHYNYGWADGYHYNIQYWEIWNEPDNEPDIRDNPCWKGTKEQFFDLYVTAANYLKEKFPELKIGGYASCGFYPITDSYAKVANSSRRTDYFVEFFHDFIDHISAPEHRAPLDFFSWHSYAAVEDNVVWADYVRNYLDSHGFAHTESILNEWNPGVQRRGTEEDACYITDMLVTMHGTSVDLMTYYNGEMNLTYGGLFDLVNYDVFPAYYSLHSYNELYELGNVAQVQSELPVLAATDGKVGKLLVSNKTREPMKLALEIAGDWRVTGMRVLDGKNGLTSVAGEGETLVVPPLKIALVEFTK